MSSGLLLISLSFAMVLLLSKREFFVFGFVVVMVLEHGRCRILDGDGFVFGFGLGHPSVLAHLLIELLLLRGREVGLDLHAEVL